MTVANYEYLVYSELLPGQRRRCEVRATGIMVVSHRTPARSRRFGPVVDEGRRTRRYHQHFMVARLDLDIDGTGNTVYQVESEAPADSTTRTGSA